MSRAALVVCVAALLPACHRPESLETARDRAAESFLVTQVADLRKLVDDAEAGRIDTRNRIAIGIAESVVRDLMDASLPQEKLFGGRLRVRIEKAQPFFRGNNAALLFHATARGVTTEATARLELGGRLVDFRIDEGRLTASVELAHFKVIESSLHDIARDVLEGLIRDNLAGLGSLVPGLEVPVHLDQSIPIDGLDHGVVVARRGVLPLEMTLAEVIPVGERLWILLDAKAGPWQSAATPKSGP